MFEEDTLINIYSIKEEVEDSKDKIIFIGFSRTKDEEDFLEFFQNGVYTTDSDLYIDINAYLNENPTKYFYAQHEGEDFYSFTGTRENVRGLQIRSKSMFRYKIPS